MTRFARAKGSKSSNVRTPEDSTPWEVMKEQLMKSKLETEDAKKREEAEKQRIENYNNFLKEHRTQKRPATWCDFPETDQPKKSKVVASGLENNTKKQKKKKNKAQSNSQQDTDNKISAADNSPSNQKKKHKLGKDLSQEPLESEQYLNDKQNEKSKIKKKKTSKEIQSNENLDNNEYKSIECEARNNKDKETHIDNLQNSNSSPTKKPKKKKNKNLKESQAKGNDDNKNNFAGDQVLQSEQNKKKKLKPLNGKPTRRKEINDRSFELIINGKNIELVRFDGFPIMKKDAERLQELKKNMIKKGIPKSEVQRTMKLERRRAEKALARVKREVCYNCRKGGHNLSDCPDLKSNLPGKDAVEGICFKCGSTEHRQFECKVQRDKEFRFATCFICRESGHIARQCPDNPKGLYPNGGSCKLCGDVTHLRKDCPTATDKKEESSIKLQTLATDNIEDIGSQVMKTHEEKQRKPKKVTF